MSVETNYKYALIIWYGPGALYDSIYIEVFNDFDKLQKRNEICRSNGYQTRIESDFNLLGYTNGN